MAKYPLVFTFSDVVSGNGFLAGVAISGSALMLQEDGAWWLYGVQPGAIAESGETPRDAHAQFRSLYRAYLFDTAESAASFDAFSGEVNRFFNTVDSETEISWNQAIEDISSGRVVPEPPFAARPREPAGHRRNLNVRVERLDTATSQAFSLQQNILDHYALAEAA